MLPRGATASGENPEACAIASEKDRFEISETGTGFAGAKLSEILPTASVARFVRMTECARSARNLTPNPFLWWKGDRISRRADQSLNSIALVRAMLPSHCALGLTDRT